MEFSDIFKGIGKIKKKYHIELEENVKPVIKPIRKIPFLLHNDFKKCLDNLEKLNIIKKVNGASEWINSYLIV